MIQSASPKILVTGATGSVGMELCKALSGRGVHFKAMVRAISKAGDLAKLPGAELVQGDFDDAGSLSNALQGIERSFLLTNSSEQAEEQQLRFVEAARQAGVLHIVKLSQWAASADSPVRFLRYHAAVEEEIRESGLRFTFLRPNLFMQGLLGFRDTIRNQGVFFGAVGDARISLIDVRDIAAVAAAALTDPAQEDKIYNLTGPEALSHNDIAEKLSAAVGSPIMFVNLDSRSLEKMLLEVGFPQWQAEGLVEDYAHYQRGEADEVASGVADATGNLPRSFDQFAKDYADYFKA
ncbi:SDR family oxidoreductase [Dyadobacter luticola]|uniref:SDR family oxidoreductase n=1 Tax=Dyadobacter luticola TaxID=1979387 RepID=A0A5R9L6G6_9BACT|nr:SDR family oxidoreductase [Dyadobacter luticola]TLV03989.1 SDR family oxidoreductase [Dyadobacter luticola]